MNALSCTYPQPQPANIGMVYNYEEGVNHVRLLDFGLARRMQSEGDLATTGLRDFLRCCSACTPLSGFNHVSVTYQLLYPPPNPPFPLLPF